MRYFRVEGENGAVRDPVRFAVLAVALLGAWGGMIAQNSDQEPNRLHTTSPNAPPPETRIDINHATVDELIKVQGNDAELGRTHRSLPALSHQA